MIITPEIIELIRQIFISEEGKCFDDDQIINIIEQAMLKRADS